MAEALTFFATTAKEMESLLAREIEEAGGQRIQVSRAGVSFEGRLETAYRVCLWSRIANRVLLPLKRISASTPEKLYGGVKSICWSDHIGREATIAVDLTLKSAWQRPDGSPACHTQSARQRPDGSPACHTQSARQRPGSRSQITHSHFAALKVKDAIVDQLRSVRGDRPSVDVVRPSVRVNVYLSNDEATVSIDLSGESLHKRGYREDGASAPLKENLAAAILMHAGWMERVRRENPADFALLDPMCGSGTLPIEAAMMAAEIAPGLSRDYYGFLGWLGHVPATWKRLVEEAEQRQIRDRKRVPRIVGYDGDFRAVRVAIANVERAGLRQAVHIEKRDLSACDRVAERGVVVVNPPYGERLGEVQELRGLYGQLGDMLKQKFHGWEGYVFTSSPELAREVGLKPSRRFVLFNGAIECRLFRYELFTGKADDRRPSAPAGG